MTKNLMSVFGGQNAKPASATHETPAAAPEKEPAATGDLESTSNRLPVMILGKTLVFKGELSADEDLMLFGRVEGSIRHTSSLTIGQGGMVVGDIHAKAIIVKGAVDGDLEATESITVGPTAQVLGDICAPRVCIVEGAQFNGVVKMAAAAPVESSAAASTVPADRLKADAVLSDKSAEQLLAGK